MSPDKPRVKSETDYSYKNKFTDKEIQFSAKPDEVVATFAGEPSEDASSAVMTDTNLAISQAVAPHPFLNGSRTVFGIMPDWNPAEIIGVRPTPLALSLYRELVTDAIWAYQRHNYGYKNLRSFPLLHHFHGLPYIDVRVSFNSFVLPP